MSDLTFSANLGFLWNDLPLPEAILRAHQAGFAAVECHWPYEHDPAAVRAALDETGLPMLGLNTVPGDSFGLSARPDQARARAAIEQAVAYAEVIDAKAIHVMAGVAQGPTARARFEDNLRFACDLTDRMILIEPINHFDVPGYFLNTTDQACEIIDAIGAPQLKLMFDCYHVARTEGRTLDRLRALRQVIGHIQIAAVPDRGAPDHGTLDYQSVFAALRDMAWDRPIGAEYKSNGDAAQDLGWMAQA